MEVLEVMAGELFLEKDPSKVDRSAAIMLDMAKNIVASGLAISVK